MSLIWSDKDSFPESKIHCASNHQVFLSACTFSEPMAENNCHIKALDRVASLITDLLCANPFAPPPLHCHKVFTNNPLLNQEIINNK